VAGWPPGLQPADGLDTIAPRPTTGEIRIACAGLARRRQVANCPHAGRNAGAASSQKSYHRNKSVPSAKPGLWPGGIASGLYYWPQDAPPQQARPSTGRPAEKRLGPRTDGAAVSAPPPTPVAPRTTELARRFPHELAPNKTKWDGDELGRSPALTRTAPTIRARGFACDGSPGRLARIFPGATSATGRTTPRRPNEYRWHRTP